MSFQEHLRDDARLRILQALSRQPANRLGDAMIQKALEATGHDKSRDWIRTQLAAMADLGAIEIVTDTPAMIVVELTAAGQDHLLRRATFAGIRRPEVGEK